MKSNKGFTLIELLAVIVILAVIALITTPIVLGIINDAKEAANKRSVEAYASALEYGVVQYEYDHNGNLPTSYCDLINSDGKNYLKYKNTDVVCNVEIDSDYASVKVTNCKVGQYTKHSYTYDSNAKVNDNGEYGAKAESETKFATKPSC